jgi:hypothetical protein
MFVFASFELYTEGNSYCMVDMLDQHMIRKSREEASKKEGSKKIWLI